MHIVSQLGLMFRANVLNQLSAKVRLVRKEYSDARLTAALRSINNRETRLADRVRSGRMTLDQFENKARKLAPYKVMLDEATHPDPAAHRGASIASQPVETVTAFRGVLIRTQCTLQADAFVDPAVKQQLTAMLDPTNLRREARQQLANAFWAGHLDETALRRQVNAQARNEASEVNAEQDIREQRAREATKDILAHIAGRQPASADAQTAALSIILSRFVPPPADDARAPTPTPTPTPSINGSMGEREGSDHIVPASWTWIATAFWQRAWPNFAEFRAAFLSARDEAIDPGTADPSPAQTRCLRTFELVEFIRAHPHKSPHSGWQATPSVLDTFADSLESEAIDSVLVERGVAPAALAAAGSQALLLRSEDSGYGSPAADHLHRSVESLNPDNDDSEQWSDGEDDGLSARF
ncbi:hypothetical protein [Stenotrophomonas sp. CFBP 13725]|uniref:hypothetical protein n=1 Tax=Stenotrophomonas sp. CFBP 13725 TaxID=2775297 RepID=UPI00177F5A89|nr:hypothetical protein [Stenotrophomonas sp. CFBP 13725]MBD8635953.1 hypothetical protein [Stenotrophomonas sp. CFBP 13725]